MRSLPASLERHRVRTIGADSVRRGEVCYAPIKSFWFFGMAGGATIGGLATFSWRTTSYSLTPKGTQTELRVRMQYRVSTRFNWYADPVARLLIGNVAEVNLDYYRHRSESVRNVETLQ